MGEVLKFPVEQVQRTAGNSQIGRRVGALAGREPCQVIMFEGVRYGPLEPGSAKRPATAKPEIR